MPFSDKVKREVQVAFSKDSQPISFRIVKYIVMLILLYLLWGTKWLLPVFGILFALGLMLHFWFRYKTAGWTKSYGAWKFKQ